MNNLIRCFSAFCLFTIITYQWMLWQDVWFYTVYIVVRISITALD